MLVLNEAEVRELLPAGDLVDAMEQALAAVEVGPERAFFGVMPAAVPTPPAVGAKLVTVFAGNAAKGLPTHHAVILLLDPETGAPAALMDGRYITAARTAAVSAVAVRHLAAGSAVLAILGSGVQARSHVETLCRMRHFREVRAWSPKPENLARFVADAAGLASAPILAAANAEAAVREADVIVLATSSTAPVIRSEWVAAGALIVSLGAYRTEMRESEFPVGMRDAG